MAYQPSLFTEEELKNEPIWEEKPSEYKSTGACDCSALPKNIVQEFVKKVIANTTPEKKAIADIEGKLLTK